MNPIARAKLDSIEHKRTVFRAVLSHFGELKDDSVAEKIAAAMDHAYTDALLFEDFEIWLDERNDDAFLYQVNHFLDSLKRPALKYANLTGKREAIERIQATAEKSLAETFAANLRALANAKGLKTNKEIGDFLGRDAEQVRTMLAAEHKPQRKTLLLVAEKFGVTVEALISG